MACDSRDSPTGVLHIEPAAAFKLDFHVSPSISSECIFTLDFIIDENQVVVESFTNPSFDFEQLAPLYSRPSLGIVVLQVVDQSGDWLKVVTHHRRQASYWVEVSQLEIKRWEDFLLGAYRIKAKACSNGLLKKGPSKKANPIEVNLDNTCLKPFKIIGDWMYLKNTPTLCQSKHIDQRPLEGFMRWRDNDQILINFIL